MKPLIALLPLLLFVSNEVHADKAAEPIQFRASVKLTVDASGKVQAAEAPASMPKALRDAIEAQVRDWRFQPPSARGVSGGGVTYAMVGACAILMGDGGYRLAVDYKANGPRNEKSNDGWLPPPQYPVDAERAGQQAGVVVDFTVGTNGLSSLNEIRYQPGSTGYHAYFDASIKQWVKSMRWLPEQLNGKMVATRLNVPINFEIGGSFKSTASERRKQAATPECQAAVASDLLQLPVAVNSPFKKLEAD